MSGNENRDAPGSIRQPPCGKLGIGGIGVAMAVGITCRSMVRPSLFGTFQMSTVPVDSSC